MRNIPREYCPGSPVFIYMCNIVRYVRVYNSVRSGKNIEIGEYMSIKIRLILGFLLSILLSTICIVGVVVWQMRADARSEFEASSRGQLSRVNNIFENAFRADQEVAAYAASVPVVGAAFGSLPVYAGKEPLTRKREELSPEGRALDDHFRLLQKAHAAFTVVSVGMEDGSYWQYPNASKTPGYDPRARGWYKQGLAGGETGVTPAFRSTGGEAIYSVIAKVRSADKVIGVLTLDISLNTLVQLLSDIRIGQTGYVMLLEDNGTILADPKHKDLLFKNIGEGGIPALKDIAKSGNVTVPAEIDGVPRFVSVFTGVRGWKLLAVIDSSEIYADTNDVIFKIILISCIIALLLLLAAVKFANTISVPLKAMVAAAGQIASGNLHAMSGTNDASLSGELRELDSSLREMVAKLLRLVEESEIKNREAEKHTATAQDAFRQAESSRAAAERNQQEMLLAAKQLESVVEIVSAASRTLAGQIEEAEQGAVEQAARVAGAATAMEQMNFIMREVSGNAQAASEFSAGTRQKAEAGSGVVAQAVQAIHQVQQESLKLKTDMHTLEEHAQSISRIMGVISDIADQTNLLALNAAIEAARAGEAGRGFAVVADEVRKLAEKTMASTTDVAAAIKAIQQSAAASMRQVDSAVVAIEQATGFANESGAALTEIVDMVDATADQVHSIARAGGQQADAGEEINRSISLMNTIADSTARSMQTASGTVEDLAGQAKKLGELITKMRENS